MDCKLRVSTFIVWGKELLTTKRGPISWIDFDLQGVINCDRYKIGHIQDVPVCPNDLFTEFRNQETNSEIYWIEKNILWFIGPVRRTIARITIH